MENKISKYSASAWESLAAILQQKLFVRPSLTEEDLRHSVVEALESWDMCPKGSVHLDYEHPSFKGKKSMSFFLRILNKRQLLVN